MKNLKILLFNWRCPKHPQAGGAEKATYEIARRWVRWGHQVQWVSGGFSGGQKYDNIDGVRVTRLGSKYSVYPQAISYYFTALRGKYDVVIDEINTIPFLTPFYVREPHVAFIHQLAANVLYEELPSRQARVLSFLEPHILRLYRNTPIFTSQSTKADLLRLGIAERNLHVINYGVDHDIYQPGKTKSSYPHVFYLGRLKRFKGVHLIIEAMGQVVKEIPEARLSIVGNGDAKYRNDLKQLSVKLNLTNHIFFHEFGLGDSLAQKVQIMQKAWVLVFPSAREGFGLVAVEANACGTPTIATNVPGLRETVRDQDTGILVERNVDALAKSIKQVLGDFELRNRISKRAFEWSLQFNWDRTAEKMLRVLESTVDRKI
jgi:glycosyltransferase involved in cell wall biosynthesis